MKVDLIFREEADVFTVAELSDGVWIRTEPGDDTFVLAIVQGKLFVAFNLAGAICTHCAVIGSHPKWRRARPGEGVTIKA